MEYFDILKYIWSTIFGMGAGKLFSQTLLDCSWMFSSVKAFIRRAGIAEKCLLSKFYSLLKFNFTKTLL